LDGGGLSQASKRKGWSNPFVMTSDSACQSVGCGWLGPSFEFGWSAGGLMSWIDPDPFMKGLLRTGLLAGFTEFGWSFILFLEVVEWMHESVPGTYSCMYSLYLIVDFCSQSMRRND
jgi:hypothetical protein